MGAAQEFTDAELEGPFLRGIDTSDPIARNPCLRGGPLSLDQWRPACRLAGAMSRSFIRSQDQVRSAGSMRTPRRQSEGGTPIVFLKARLKAASES